MHRRKDRGILDRAVAEDDAIGPKQKISGVWEQPFIFYGTDWLAFGHIAIAVFFLGPLQDPVRNLWVIQAGMIACALVIPWAMVFGPIRGIPFFWRLIDCSFGVFGIIPLCLAYRCIQQTIHAERHCAENAI